MSSAGLPSKESQACFSKRTDGAGGMVRGLGNPHHSVQEAFEEFGDDGLHNCDSRTGQRGWELTEARNPGGSSRRGEGGQKPPALRTREGVYTELFRVGCAAERLGFDSLGT